ncbi:hypothetical protein [Pseudooceanicola sp. LIPI14-2-Ac024]|uniref:hypothetical protein n=1 Tax=Pseudooceanicola sp. LIPI14-2-Ac024 TaxID=3344875 RepID=UPI0035CEB877
MSEFFKLAHLYRGSWFARATNLRSIELFGTEPVPILHDREEGAIDWQGKPGPTYQGLESEGGPDWWMAPEHEAWRKALAPGKIVWVRQVMPNGVDDPAAGASKGLWKIGAAEIGPGRLHLYLTERIGDVT